MSERNNISKHHIETKYIYRDICALIFTAIASAFFFYNWYGFVSVHNQTGSLLGYGNLGMALILYAGTYFLIGKWLHAFKIGVERKANVLAAQVLTLFTADAIEIVFSILQTGQFRFFFDFISLYTPMFLLVAAINCAITIPMIDVYRKHFPPLRMIEVYGQYQDRLYEKISSVKYKYDVVKTINRENGLEDIRAQICNYDAVLLNDLPAHDKNTILKLCFELDKRVYFVPKISDILVKNSEELNLFDTPLFLDRNSGLRQGQLIVKRFFDVALSLLALSALSPILLITALAIKLEDHGPVFYTQERVTLNDRHFVILKFRSMIVDAEKDGRPHPAGEKDDRITKVGRIIRACRVDELPQLINILKGDMSIVGPRPERWEHVEEYSKEIPEFRFRHKVRGGLTGYAQVYGQYNTRALDKLKLDLIYITNYSLLLDLQIIFQTVKILVQKESTEGFSEEASKALHDGIDSTKEN